MQVCYNIEHLPEFKARPVVSVGNFDGVHVGHQALMATMAERARLLGGAPTVALTFDPHPLSLLRPDKPLNMISSREERFALLHQAGAQTVLCLNFNHDLASLPAEDFISRILAQKLKAKELVEGFNFNFGKMGKGNVELLRELGPKYDYIVHQVAPVIIENQPVSSSRVRRAILSGDFKLAAGLLGRAWQISGQVVHGEGRGGSLLKTPTANLALPENQLLPPQGVYAAKAGLHHKKPALFNLGVNPTFQGLAAPRLEVHILDYDGQLYGREIQVEPVAFLRAERKFSSPQELKIQMERDIEQARRLFVN